MNTGTEEPNRGIAILPIIGWKPMPRARNYGSQKWLGWLDDM
jgi:hypothetical protein